MGSGGRLREDAEGVGLAVAPLADHEPGVWPVEVDRDRRAAAPVPRAVVAQAPGVRVGVGVAVDIVSRHPTEDLGTHRRYWLRSLL